MTPTHVYLCECPECHVEWIADVPPHHVRHEYEVPRCPRCDRLTKEEDRRVVSVEEMKANG